jgi:Protein of unknown function (DUF2608).
MKKFFVVWVSCLFTAIYAFDSNTLAVVEQYAQKGDYVVFDLDDTVEAPVGEVGSDTWFGYYVNKVKVAGLSEPDAINLVAPLYYLVHFYINLQAVDRADELIKKLQARGIYTLAITSRSKHIAARTITQLENIGIDFSKGCPCKDDFELGVTWAGKYSHGVIFNGNNDKGEMLFHFFYKTGIVPQKVIFVDDKQKHVDSVAAQATKNNVAFIGIRFSGSDTRKNNFSAQQAEQELIVIKRELGLAPLSKVTS